MKPLGLLFMCNKLCNKSSNKIPSYLTIRNGVYYFCYRVPSAISPDQPTLIRFSLRTKSPIIAQQRIANLLPIVYSAKKYSENRCISKVCDSNRTVTNNVSSEEDLLSEEELSNKIDALQNRSIPDNSKELVRNHEIRKLTNLLKELPLMCESAFKSGGEKLEMTSDEFGELSGSIYSTITRPESRALIREDQRKITIQKHLSNKSLRKLLSDDEIDKIDLLTTVSKMVDIDVEVNAEKVKLLAAYCASEEQKYDATVAKLESKLNRLLTERMANSHLSINIDNETDKTSDLPKISDFIPEFLEWKEGNRSRTKDVQQTYSRDLNFLIHVIGDKPINKVAKEDIKETLNFKKCMPVMNKNPYRQWGVEETVQKIKEGYEVEDDEDLVSSKTVKETLKCYQSFFSSFLFKEKDLLEKSPTENVTLTYESESYAPYTDTQMVDIVNYCRENPSEKTMVILIGAYTGMRLSEICNLTKESIRHDEESGYNYIFIKKGKTPAACRIVPICNKLKSAGLLEHINSFKSEQKMFSKKIDLITNEIQKIREILHIPHENEFGQRRVFHSIRHSVITKVRSKQISDPVLQKVVGHQTVKSITDRYTHNFPVKDLTCVVDCLDW